jgi:hypothetical protein
MQNEVPSICQKLLMCIHCYVVHWENPYMALWCWKSRSMFTTIAVNVLGSSRISMVLTSSAVSKTDQLVDRKNGLTG